LLLLLRRASRRAKGASLAPALTAAEEAPTLTAARAAAGSHGRTWTAMNSYDNKTKDGLSVEKITSDKETRWVWDESGKK
jgi:hypothetical protein